MKTQSLGNFRLERKWLVALILAALAVISVVVWLWGYEAWLLLTDTERMATFVERAGPWGPVALILLNMLQIVIAIIPGHVVQLAAGYLYGPLWGGIYAAIGLLLGAMTAMALARFFGRPVARWLVGEAKLNEWEKVTHTDSLWVWALLMLGPVGDIPFALAGLSSVSFVRIFWLTLFIRVPTAFLSTAVGGGAIPFYWLLGLIALAWAATLVALRYREPIVRWFDGLIAARSTAGDGKVESALVIAIDSTGEGATDTPLPPHHP